MRLPYFKFIVDDYIMGDITTMDLDVQGLFINLCAYYWKKNCNMDLANAKQRFGNSYKLFEKLIEKEIISVDENEQISINFLLEQFERFETISTKRSKSGRKGGKAKAKQMLRKCKANGEQKPIYKDKDKEEDNTEVFNFKSSLIKLGIDKEIVSAWLKVRAKKKAVNSEIAFKGFVREIKQSGLSPNECIKKAVENSWSGFKAEWLGDVKKGIEF